MVKNIVEYMGKCYFNFGDFHTHTIYSMHGMSSPEEMVNAAEESGLSFIAITDHHFPYMEAKNYNDPMYFLRKNQEARMWEYSRSFSGYRTKVIPGYEYNLFVPEDIDHGFIDYPHLRLIGLHTWHCYVNELTPTELINEVNARLGTGKYHILVHPERELHMLRYNGDHNSYMIRTKNYTIRRGMATILEDMIVSCKENNVLLEVNESSIITGLSTDKSNGNVGRMLFWLERAKDTGMDIIVSTDSHISKSVGKTDFAFSMLSNIEYPPEHIVNFDIDKINKYIISKL